MTGFGVPSSSAGGTTTEDIQRIIAAEYQNAGIIDGCDVSGTAGMAYRIRAGAVVLDTGPDMAIKVPVAAQDVPTTAAPATGSRTDTIYVRQLFPTESAPDNSSFVGVTSGSTPPNSIVLDRRTVTAGTTATTATTSIHNRKFARPIGASLGRRHEHVESDGTPRTTGVFTRGAGTIYLPTDRTVEFRLLSTVSASSASGDGINEVGSLFYRIYLDSNHLISFERRYDGYSESKFFSHVVDLGEGQHTVHYTVQRSGGGDAGRWAVRHGGPHKFPGDRFAVYDRGVYRY